jgi:hypothetical protein
MRDALVAQLAMPMSLGSLLKLWPQFERHFQENRPHRPRQLQGLRKRWPVVS